MALLTGVLKVPCPLGNKNGLLALSSHGCTYLGVRGEARTGWKLGLMHEGLDRVE